MAPTRGEYALLPVQVTSPGPPARHSSLTPRFRTSTSQASEHDDDDDDDDHVPSPPSPDDVPRVLRRTRPRWSLAPSWPRLSLFRRPSLLVLFLLIVVIILFGTATAAVLRWVHATWELHIMLDFYPRQWWAPSLEPPPPLSGCFSPGRLSPLYNVSERVFGPRHTDIHAGLSRLLLPPSSSSSSSGGDCYDFASTVKSREEEKEDTEPFLLHSFWPAGRAPFGPRQEAMLKSVLATQPRARSRLVLWSDRDISTDVLLRAYVERHGSSGGRRRIELRVVDLPLLAEGTELEDSALMRSPLSGGSSSVSNADADAELIRLLVLWRYGGVWVDMDSLLTRDLTPLLEHEFVTQWKCDYGTWNGSSWAALAPLPHPPRGENSHLCIVFYLLKIRRTHPRWQVRSCTSINIHHICAKLSTFSRPPPHRSGHPRTGAPSCTTTCGAV